MTTEATEKTTITDDLDSVAEARAGDLLEAILGRALGGDMRAAQMVFDRVWQQREGRLVAFELPLIAKPGDVGPALDKALRLAADGVLTLKEAERLMGLISARSTAFATSDVEAQLQALRDATARVQQQRQQGLRAVK